MLLQYFIHPRPDGRVQLTYTAVWFRSQVMSRGIYGGQSGTGVVIFLLLRFPLPILKNCFILINDTVIRRHVASILTASLNRQLDWYLKPKYLP
jgi:hypothetical protein